MNAKESRGHFERAEAALAECAERLIRFPLDPAHACAALESARATLEGLRREWRPADRELNDALRNVAREAARVRRLLEGAAMFAFPCLAAPVLASYTPAGEMQSAGHGERFALQG